MAGVTDAYRRRIDAYLACPEKKTPVPQQDRKLLSSLYVRTGLGSGYLKKHNGRDMVTLDQPGYAGCDDGLLEEIRGRLLERDRELPVTLSAELQAGKPFRLTARAGEFSVRMEGETVQPAQKRPMSEEEIRKQLSRTGGSGFAAEKIDVAIKGDVFLPVKSINELRRGVLEKLRGERIAAYRAGRSGAEAAGGNGVRAAGPKRRRGCRRKRRTALPAAAAGRAVCPPGPACQPLYIPFPSWKPVWRPAFPESICPLPLSAHRCAGGWKRRGRRELLRNFSCRFP